MFRSFSPSVEGLSVDEAFLDISGLRLHYDSPAAAGEALRAQIRRQLGLPASVGIAAAKFISKLASDAAKPDGLLVVPRGAELDFLHPMPVRRLWGVGEATRATLEGMDVTTVGELAAVPVELLQARLGPSLAHHLSRLAAGIDEREVEPGGDAKSVSVEETFSEDLVDKVEIDRAVLRLCHRLSSRLHRSGFAGSVISLKVRFGDFETVSRSQTLPEPIEHTTELRDEVEGLLAKVEMNGRGVRLLGVGLAGLVDSTSPRQLSLEARPRHAAAGVVELVRDRFGDDAVLPASLLPQDGPSNRGK